MMAHGTRALRTSCDDTSESVTHSKCREKCGGDCPAPVYDDHEFIDAYDDWQGEP